MNIHSLIGRGLLLGALLLGAAAARADIALYKDLADFNARLVAPGTDTFFGLALVDANSSPLSRRTLVGASYRYEISASSSSLVGIGTDSDTCLTSNVASDVITF